MLVKGAAAAVFAALLVPSVSAAAEPDLPPQAPLDDKSAYKKACPDYSLYSKYALQ